jgi:hypothetical protein
MHTVRVRRPCTKTKGELIYSPAPCLWPTNLSVDAARYGQCSWRFPSQRHRADGTFTAAGVQSPGDRSPSQPARVIGNPRLWIDATSPVEPAKIPLSYFSPNCPFRHRGRLAHRPRLPLRHLSARANYFAETTFCLPTEKHSSMVNPCFAARSHEKRQRRPPARPFFEPRPNPPE